jgi:hypothetical protein
MNCKQLQEAIDKTMAMAMNTTGGYQQDKFREMAKAHLEQLFKIQAMRAELVTKPLIIKNDFANHIHR